jgi:hypothetical protein
MERRSTAPEGVAGYNTSLPLNSIKSVTCARIVGKSRWLAHESPCRAGIDLDQLNGNIFPYIPYIAI